jgi:hypothetical protein
VTMNKTSAYVNTVVFLDLLIKSFHTKEGTRKVLLILDGHTSRCSDGNVLDFTSKNDIIIVCLPSYTTHYLPPSD